MKRRAFTLEHAFRCLFARSMARACFEQVLREKPDGWLGNSYGVTVDVARWSVQKGKCFYCGKPLHIKSWKRSRGNGWTRDHVVPLSRGGSNGGGNIVMACQRCNQRKDDRRPEKHETKTAYMNWQKVRRFGAVT